MSSTHANKPDLSDSNVRLGTAGATVQQTAAIVGICGLLASAVMQMVRRPPPSGGLQVAWQIARTMIAHSLDYDCRVLPSNITLPHAAVVESQVDKIHASIIGAITTAEQKKQLTCPHR